MDTRIAAIKKKVEASEGTLLVVSKKRSNEAILRMYDYGFRQMGENRVQDLLDKKDLLPTDIEWHIIGVLQRNKVKYIAGFVAMIHSVDSVKLAKEINKQAKKYDRVIPILLQFKVAEEETKQGIAPSQKNLVIQELLDAELNNISVQGMMGMASFTDDEKQVRSEFKQLHTLFQSIQNDYKEELPEFTELSMGMSGDYEIALDEGSTMVRLGSVLFQ